MRIIHTADLHLESPLSQSLPPQKARQRRSELYGTLRRMVDEARFIRAEAFIIAGDLFDCEKVSPLAKERFLSAVSSAPEIKFFLLGGNHDKGIFENYKEPLPENLFLFKDTWTTYDLGLITVSGRVGAGADIAEGLSLDESRLNIAVLHGSLGDGRGENGIDPSSLCKKGIDYLALGHYHSYMQIGLDSRTLSVYSGTPEGRGFDEAGDCGFVLIETDGVELRHSFVSFAKRRVTLKRIDLTGIRQKTEAEGAVRNAISKLSREDQVRVVLVGNLPPEATVSTALLEEELREEFFHLEIKDETRADIRAEAFATDKSLKGEFIRLVLSREDMSEEEKEAVVRCGIGALLGEVNE